MILDPSGRTAVRTHGAGHHVGMTIRRSALRRFLERPAGQFAVVTVLMLALFALVNLGVTYVLDAVFGGHWMVY